MMVGSVRVASVAVGSQSVGSVVVGTKSIPVGVVEEGWVSLSLGGSRCHGGETENGLERAKIS